MEKLQKLGPADDRKVYTLIIFHRDIDFPLRVAYCSEVALSRAASNPTVIRSVPAIFPTDQS